MQTDSIQLRELTVRYSIKKTDGGDPVVVGRALKSPRESAALLMRVLQDQPTEVFAILCLSTKHRVIAFHEVSRGTLDSTNTAFTFRLTMSWTRSLILCSPASDSVEMPCTPWTSRP